MGDRLLGHAAKPRGDNTDSSKSKRPKPITLIIFDGWGYSKERETNAIALAHIPTFTNLWATCPHTLIEASGKAVGLPDGQMGNSEVGHLNLGAGRVVYQDICRISNAIEEGSFFKNPVLVQTIKETVSKGKAIHIFGLLSPGGVHSLDEHIYALVKMCAQLKAKSVYIHAFLDGRDTPPRSAEAYIDNLEKVLQKIGVGKIVSLAGRFYAMDRDKRWDRIEQAYHLIVLGESIYSSDKAIEGLRLAYAHGENDEFVKPTSIHDLDKAPITVQDGDSIIFMNFRSDRARELTRTFIEPEFKEFHRKKIVQLTQYVSLTQYDVNFGIPVVFPPESLINTLGTYLSQKGLSQLRIAETEKYAHVTFFFNGGVEAPNSGEDRVLIPSPKVQTYDLQPEMSAPEVSEKLVKAIRSAKYDVIICNFANADMVGHTGSLSATILALECLDRCLAQIVEASTAVGGEIIIIGDHGNAEVMFDPVTQQPMTAHTTNPVPFIYKGRSAVIAKTDGALCDISPTILTLLNLPIPSEMTGKSIVKLKE